MLFDANPCTETVSPLTALLMGAGDACVSLAPMDIAGLAVPFIVAVVVLQWLARSAIRRVFGQPAPSAHIAPAPPPAPIARQRTGPLEADYDGGPIRSTGAWRD